MKDLTNPTWIKTKGVLFLVLGFFSGALLLLDHPSAKAGFLLAISVWSSCRFYYFCFYVIEKYVDSAFKFSGVFAALLYLVRERRMRP